MSWRRVTWRYAPPRVLACLMICSLAVACTNAGSGAPPDAFQLTGYRSVSPMGGGTGAVTVALTAADGEDIVSLAEALPKGPIPDCMENAVVYQITVEHAPGLVRGTVISGYQCGAAVSVAVPGSILSWRTDDSCRLYEAVRPLVPSRAVGTRQAGVVC